MTFGRCKALPLLGAFVGAVIVAFGGLAWTAAHAEPRLEINFSHYETNHAARLAIVTVTNVGRTVVVYRGYAQSGPGCELEQRMGDGTWQSRILRCGTGLVDQMLFPGEMMSGQLFVRGEGEWRAGLRYRKRDLIDSLPQRLRNDALAVIKKRPPWQSVWTTEIRGFPGEE
jgi:hypothetical protein